MSVPDPTRIVRFVHVDNLEVCMRRGGLHAPNHTPNDGLTYRTIHNVEIQAKRRVERIPCGPRGTIHDYVSFYFGYLSPMMFQLKTGRVPGYSDGQEPLIYLVTTAQAVQAAGVDYVFSDGHGIAVFTNWFDDLADLDKVDWSMVEQRYWSDNVNDMDRQRRKQAEFLIHGTCDWVLISEIAVIDGSMKARVDAILADFAESLRQPVVVRNDWYYH
ncbi:MAG: DUF4433 domain-containing protein [Planctomycetes bacterium]|nr:DUF4433 domain-containing protein [Planctomycetota bacterium]